MNLIDSLKTRRDTPVPEKKTETPTKGPEPENESKAEEKDASPVINSQTLKPEQIAKIKEALAEEPMTLDEFLIGR